MLSVLYIIITAFIVFVLARTILYTGRNRFVQPVEKDDIPIDDAVRRLSRAIQFETVSTQSPDDINGEAFTGMHLFLEKEFPLIHSNLKREVINHYSLLFTWRGSNSELKPVMLTSHLDVVPVEPGTETDWEHPPFGGNVSDSYIWGRGAMDVQCGVLAILESVEWLLANGYQPERTIYLGFGHDEEIDGEFGASSIGQILKERGVELDFLLDEGLPIVEELMDLLKGPVALVAIAEKGYLSVELSVETGGGHSSVPQGLTSIALLSEAIHKLENNPMPARIDGLVKEMLQSLGSRMAIAYRIVMANIWLFQRVIKDHLTKLPETSAVLRTTGAATIFESGMKENVLPTQARAVINFRLHPSDSIADVIDHVRKTINDPRIRITKMHGHIEPSRLSDVSSESYKTLRRTIREVFPEVTVSPALMIGATDARHYAALTPNIYRFLPLRASRSDLDRVHGTNERLSIGNYEEMIQFYIQLLRNTSVIKTGPGPIRNETIEVTSDAV
ncbi:MAG: M20 family peptidase [Cyclonatronaceae bacterium]